MNALVLNKKVFPALVTTYAHISLLPIINYAVKNCSTGDLQLGFVRRERNKHLVVHFLLRKEPFLRNKKKCPVQRVNNINICTPNAHIHIPIHNVQERQYALHRSFPFTEFSIKADSSIIFIIVFTTGERMTLQCQINNKYIFK